MGRLASQHLDRQRFVNYLPVAKEWRQPKRAVEPVPTSIPLFPGYIFVRFDLAEDHWTPINGTRGIVKLLPTFMNEPTPLPVGFVEELQEQQRAGKLDVGSGNAVAYSYAKGQAVEVASGPFAGFGGEFVKYHKGSLIILMALLGQKNRVPMRPHQVRPADITAAA